MSYYPLSALLHTLNICLAISPLILDFWLSGQYRVHLLLPTKALFTFWNKRQFVLFTICCISNLCSKNRESWLNGKINKWLLFLRKVCAEDWLPRGHFHEVFSEEFRETLIVFASDSECTLVGRTETCHFLFSETLFCYMGSLNRSKTTA